MQGNVQRDTTPEMAIRRELHARGFRYRVAYPPVGGLRRTADIAFLREKVAVLIDGCFWHGCPEHYAEPSRNAEYWRRKISRNRSRDLETAAIFQDSGWTVLRFWAHECPSEVVANICHVVVRKRCG